MNVINWFDLHLLELEIEEISQHATAPIQIRDLCRVMVNSILKQFPWDQRSDLIRLYHPSESYQQGEWIALPLFNQKSTTVTPWQIGKIKQVISAQNPFQESFQVLEFDSRNYESRACGIQTAVYPVPDYSSLSNDEIAGLTEYVINNYFDHLVQVIARLIMAGNLNGKIVGLNYIPNRSEDMVGSIIKDVFLGLSFEKPIISTEEILQAIKADDRAAGIAEQDLKDLIQKIMIEFQYKDLGNGYWTTEKLFNKMMREIPRGVPAPHIHSTIGIWTDDDNKHLQANFLNPIPDEVKELDEEESMPNPQKKVIPDKNLNTAHKLPTLTYLHITQAYFPVAKIIHVFPSEATLIRVRLVKGDYQNFILNRETGHLTALNKESFFNSIHGEFPAGTFFWLKSEGDGRFVIAPKVLRQPRIVTCKLVRIEKGKLVIEKTEMVMKYQGDARIFKADLRFTDIEAFYRDARRSNLSVRDAIIRSIQELTEGDPDDCAHISDIFNLVFLKRMCSPRSVSLMLYTQPCFKQLGEGYFRYEPIRLVKQQANNEDRNQPSEVGSDIVVELIEDQTGRTNLGTEPEPNSDVAIDVMPETPVLKNDEILPIQKSKEKTEGNQLPSPWLKEKPDEGILASNLLPEEIELPPEIPAPSIVAQPRANNLEDHGKENAGIQLPLNPKVNRKPFIIIRIWRRIARLWKRIMHKSQEDGND